MVSQLYTKIMQGKKTTYKPVVEDPGPVLNLDEGESLTAAGALGVTLLMIFERNMPPHKTVARKIKAVKDSVLDLYKGTGKEIDDDIALLIFNAWDKTMKSLSGVA